MVDTHANCFVKRNHTTKSLVLPVASASDLPEGLPMRELVERDDDPLDLGSIF